MLFQKKDNIDKYTVVFPHKQSAYAETYRVKDDAGRLLFLKLISFAKLNSAQYSEEGKIIEVEVAKILSHNNLCGFVEAGTTLHEGQQYAFIVTEFVSAETVAEKMAREHVISVYETKQIAISILKALSFIHSLNIPIIHNEVTPQNAMLNLVGSLSDTKLIDFGHARFLNQPPSKEDLKNINPFYLAPERFNGVCCVQSDLYSVGVLIYQLIFGILPWYIDLSQYEPQERLRVLQQRRSTPLSIPNMDLFELDEQLINIMAKAMSNEVSDRFQSADEFIKALEGEIKVDGIASATIKGKAKEDLRKRGNGFKDVAGMDELKDQLRSDVIELLQNPEQARNLGLSIPNGLLFFGPPGCGKTFFAEKFAEEIGCSYIYVHCSDVASPYIHGGQEKIAAVFEKARENAPTILFLDEVESMIKTRDKHNNVSEAGEVNEFLSQLNNCGKDGVLVIAASNLPTEIDEAALRAGRLELKYYIAPPDFETRKKIFEVILKKRKVDFGIDYEKLAQLTENRVSADITLIIDNAARIIFRQKQDKITQAALEEAINTTKPTVTLDVIKKHEQIRDAFFGVKKERTKIGF